MKRILIIPIGIAILAMAVVPVLAQEDDAFFDVLRSNLSEQAIENIDGQSAPSEIRAERESILGESVVFESATAASSNDLRSEPYVAGRDTLSGPIAAGAVLLTVIIIILIFFIVTSSGRSDEAS